MSLLLVSPRFSQAGSSLAGIFLMLAAAVACPAATVSVSNSAPVSQILVSTDAPRASAGNQIDKNSVPFDRFGGPTFILPESSIISAVTFHTFAVGASSPGKQMSVSLVSFGDFTTESITYTTLHTETVTLPDAATLTADKYVTFNFSTPASLTAGTYGIVLRFLGASSDGIRFSLATTNTAESSSFRINDHAVNGITYSITSPEYYYAVQGVSQIPEASASALILGGVALGGVCLRRRRALR